MSWYSSFRSVGFVIGNVRQGTSNVESGLAIEYGGGGGQEDGQKSQFHSLFFTQAAVIANDIWWQKKYIWEKYNLPTP